MAADFGPEHGTERWKNQLETVCKALRCMKDKKQLERIALMFVLDKSYSRGAITQAMHDVEIERGWHA